MAEFAEQISDLKLYQELDLAAGRDAIPASDVVKLKGLVNDVADTVGPLLGQILVTFRQYTVHDIPHCQNVIKLMGHIIPAETRGKLNALEITFLLLSALLHDAGMVVSDHEKKEALESVDFRRFRAEGHADRNKAIEKAQASGNDFRARAIEDALLAEFYRRLHPERARLFMDRHLAGRLRFQERDFTHHLALLCESHAWGVEESNDSRHPDKAVARLDDDVRFYGIGVNLQYLACILRLADILDFDRSRTPLAVFQHLAFSESKSWEEWNKHLQVQGWKITPTQVAFEIPCTHPVFYVAVHEFLGWIDDELRQCRYLVENKPQATAERYQLHLPQVVDRHKVRMADNTYVAGAFRFQLEYENILTLLMDKSLYPDPSLFLRELLQNALDACRRKEADMEVRGLKQIYTPKIVVWDKTDDPNDPRVVFQDNGIGMSQRIVEHYFLRVGRSYYRSPEFDAERQRLQEHGKELDACSQFGIGILSCFLVGDRFEVETFQEGHDPLHILIEGPTKYFVMRKLPWPDAGLLYQKPSSDEADGPPNRTGTRITVHFRAGVKVDVWQVLDKFAVNVDYPISVYCNDGKKSKPVPALRWEKPVPIEEWQFHLSGGGTEKLPALGKALIPSIISFTRWDFSRHLRGCAWFWLLRDPGGQPTPNSGSLEVGSELRLVGIPAIVAQLEAWWSHHTAQELTFREWFDRWEKSRDALDNNAWPMLSGEDWANLSEVITRRSDVIKRGEWLQPWAQLPAVVTAFLRGSTDWADQSVALCSIPDGDVYESIYGREEAQIALHSILIPAGIVRWSPADAWSERGGLVPFFGGLRIDVRGQQAPRPAAHRLFIPREEAEGFSDRYFHASLLHGIGLAVQHGPDPMWRRWFCELAEHALGRGLKRVEFAKLSGQLVEDTFGLAVKVNEKKAYLARVEILNLIPGPICFVNKESESQGLLLYDPINELLCLEPMYAWSDHEEVDLSNLPIKKAKK